ARPAPVGTAVERSTRLAVSRAGGRIYGEADPRSPDPPDRLHPPQRSIIVRVQLRPLVRQEKGGVSRRGDGLERTRRRGKVEKPGEIGSRARVREAQRTLVDTEVL